MELYYVSRNQYSTKKEDSNVVAIRKNGDDDEQCYE